MFAISPRHTTDEDVEASHHPGRSLPWGDPMARRTRAFVVASAVAAVASGVVLPTSSATAAADVTATLAATPTTGLHDGSGGTASATSVPDGFRLVRLEECNVAAVSKYASGDWETKSCTQLVQLPVAD